MKQLFLVLFFLFTGATSAEAVCTWKWDCSVNGAPCRHIPVCDSTLDLPPIQPLELPPAPSIAPIPPMEPLVIPPIGTTHCRQVYTCNNAGLCRYQTLCR